MLFRDTRLYSVSFSSSCRPYDGWFEPSILMATEGWPRLQSGICLWSRSMDVLVFFRVSVWGGGVQVGTGVKGGNGDLHSAEVDDFLCAGDGIRLDCGDGGEEAEVALDDIDTDDDGVLLVEDGDRA